MSNIEMKYNPEDWCVDKNDCDKQCDCETKQDNKNNDKDKCNCKNKKEDKNKDKACCEKQEPIETELVQLDRENWNIQSYIPKEWHC